MKWFYALTESNRAHVARSVMEALRVAPVGYVVRITEPTRNLEQNALLHALLTEAGELIGWKFNGQAVDIEDLKSVFMAAFRKTQGQDTRFVFGLDGQPVILNWRTRELSKRECAEFVDMVQAWMAEQRR